MPDKRPSGLLSPERFRFPRLRLLRDVFAARRALNDNPPSEAA
jgi:hypothetical protein